MCTHTITYARPLRHTICYEIINNFPLGVESVSLSARQAGGGLAEVAFLGTGSAEPSKYRGPSAIHVRLEYGSMMADAGENTLGQLERAHGPKAAQTE
eukprot:scaffold190370_cov24-Prasinocladus_malaysianus.AAC.1